MSKIKKYKMKFSDEVLNFKCNLAEFKEDENSKGKFKGLLVNMQGDNTAKGIYRFKTGSMKKNDGKKLFLQYNHEGSLIPIGTLIGKETKEGFEVEGTFHLQKDESGAYINPEAMKVYSLMKDLGAEFEMSVGGVMTKFKDYVEDGKYYIDILEFDAYEGSLTPKAAVPGSKVTRVFGEENIGGNKMEKDELIALFTGILETFKADLLKAGTDEEIAKLPVEFSKLTEQFNGLKDSLEKDLKENFSKQINELNDVLKGLKADFKATEEEVDDATQFKAMLLNVKDNGQKSEIVFNEDSKLEFKDMVVGDGKTGSTTGKAIVTTTIVKKILERIQDSNPVLKDITFITTDDAGITIPREMAGLPEVGWVGEVEERKDTAVTKVENITVNIFQLYALPVVTNKLLATNYVGYATFLLKRVEYALGLKLADSVFNGSGTNMPLGILKDTAVTNQQEIDTSDDAKFIESIIDIYYSIPTDVAKESNWYIRRETWQQISKLKNTNKDFYITDLNTGNTRTLMSRPVELVESEGSGLKTLKEAVAVTDPVMVFGNVKEGLLGIENPKMTMKLEDQITSKGLTKYYMEKGVGVGVQLPEYFVKVVKKA
ncbi:phage major capsid protein [Fusobacterium pseudoperiodonticum]|uniref:phage major capsid protein n=1 Tax=Fusobacterium pseudoperiodonticum TaxID=2663009 RepID=UPI000C1C82CF|nr:phage major capsid protein [Fusobacterium pseudoperiodonticum]ATV72088.1 phage major capsid protein [Fusobacterium pseudoperiodonticum]